MSTQNLNSIVNVVVEVSPAAAPRSNFNEFLIIGNSAGTGLSTSVRTKLYTSLDAMITDGFTTSDPEYLAAALYVQTLYAYFGTGAAFSLWLGFHNTTGSESAHDAVVACRAANAEWYACAVVTSTVAKADHEAIAGYIETALPASLYAYTTADSDALAGTTGNVFSALKIAGYSRSIGQYSTESAYAICSLMGYAMGQLTLVANGVSASSFTLKFKQEKGVTAEPLSSASISTIEGINGNILLNYANFYNIFEQGVMANGQFFDEVVQLDILANRIQLVIMDLLYQNPKIPQTDGGVAILISNINQQCDFAVTTGFIAPGVWNNLPVLNLSTGYSLPKGYVVQAATIASQSQVDRAARKAPPIYVAIKEAGAIHSALITVNVNQ
jgi:hypothetical protein